MSNTLEYESEGESSQGNLEYHSGQESEPDRMQIILVNRAEEFMFLKHPISNAFALSPSVHTIESAHDNCHNDSRIV